MWELLAKYFPRLHFHCKCLADIDVEGEPDAGPQAPSSHGHQVLSQDTDRTAHECPNSP